MRKYIIVLLAAAFVAACGPSTSGVDFNVDRMKSFKAGVTTKADVRRELGAPKEVKTVAEGELWTYRFSSAHMTGVIVKTMTTVGKVAVLGFDHGGVLRQAELSANRIVGSGFSAGPDVDKIQLTQFRQGVTRPQEVRDKLGPPQGERWTLAGLEVLAYTEATAGGSTKTVTFTFSNGRLTDMNRR